MLRAILLTIFIISSLFGYELTPDNFYKTIQNNRVVIVKFWASWCPSCRILAPKFEEAKSIVGKRALFATYNVDLQSELLSKYNIEMIPTMVIFVNGKEVERNNSPLLTSKEIANWVLNYVQ